MEQKRPTHWRLAAILAIDAAGYSRRMGEHADRALADMTRVFVTTVRPAVRAHRGRVVKLLGDGALVVFGSASDALAAAVTIQSALRDDPVHVRIGIDVGDVTELSGDVFGHAVNVASRLQAEADEGGTLVSRATSECAVVGNEVTLRPEGGRYLKNIDRPVEVFAVDLTRRQELTAADALARSQAVRFAISVDGTHLAWTSVGSGPPLVKAPNWVQHLERDWQMPNAGVLAALAARRTLVRFDARGNGLSDRQLSEVSLERFVEDLDAVWRAARIERAPIIAMSQGCATSIAFAVRHPERVAGLILLGGFAQGRARRAGSSGQPEEALVTLARAGWDDAFPSLRDHFAQLLYPELAMVEQRAFAELMREIISAEQFARFRRVVDEFDVLPLLPQVACPALILHSRDERLHPLEEGRRLAAGIPNARFVALPGANHLPTTRDRSWPMAAREIDAFLAGLG